MCRERRAHAASGRAQGDQRKGCLLTREKGIVCHEAREQCVKREGHLLTSVEREGHSVSGGKRTYARREGNKLARKKGTGCSEERVPVDKSGGNNVSKEERVHTGIGRREG